METLGVLMATTETSRTDVPPAPRSGFRWRWIAGGFAALLVPLLVSFYFAPPALFFTALLQRKVHELTGRELTVESSHYVLREIVTVELTGVAVRRPGQAKEMSPFMARKITARVPLRSILNGNPEILSLDLEAPVVNLVRDLSGAGNWQSPSPQTVAPETVAALPVPPTTMHNGTFLFKDEGNGTDLRLDALEAALAADAKYGGAAAKGSFAYNNEPLRFDFAVSDAAAALAGRMTTLALVIDSRILKARVSGQGAIGETPMLAGEIDATSPSARELAQWLGFGDSVPTTAGALAFKAQAAPDGAAAHATGTLVLRDAPLSYDLTLASLREAMAGRSTGLKGSIAGQGVAAGLDGAVNLGPETSYSGAVSAKAEAIGKLAGKLGITHPALTALGPGQLQGTVAARAGKVSLSDTTFDADGRTGEFNGDLAFDGPRPRVSGRLTLSQLDLDALLGRSQPASPAAVLESVADDDGFATTFDVLAAELDAIEKQPASIALENAAVPEALPAGKSWNTAPIDLKALRSADLDLDVSVTSLRFGQIPLANAQVKTKLTNGELAASIETIAIGQGTGSGAIELNSRGAAHEAAVSLKLVNVDVEPISAELSGKPLLQGSSTVDINMRATGRSLADLVSTLDGKARIDMKKGQLRGWDIGAMVAELWNYKGWGYTRSRSTPVNQLTANYVIKAGTIQSAPDLTLRGPTAGLRSVGNVVVPRRLIDQTVDVQNLLFNIVIKGDWTKKLWIGPTFLSGVQPAPGAALEATSQPALPAAALPVALPPALAARIGTILSDAATASRLTVQQKQVLEAFISGARPAT